MSNESIDLLWDESIHGLKKLIQDEEESINQSKSVSIPDAFLHFAKLYVRYTIILSNLGTCYDAAIQPQKRLDIKSTLEHVVSRVINLRHLLVKWAPPNADVISKDAAQQPFPWEYVDFNQALKELRVPPCQLEIATPSFLIDDSLQRIRSRNAFVASRLLEKFGPEVIPLEEKKWVVEPLATVSTEKEHRERKAIHNPRHDAQNKVTNIIPDHAATIIQTSVRGHICKKKTERDRQWLKGFVGMSDSSNVVKFNQLKNNISDIREKRKQEQSYCQESYEADLHSLKEVVRQEEGFGMQTDLREERIKWITDHVVNKNTLPDSFEEFYAKDVTPPDNAGDPKQLVDGKIDSSKSSKDKKGSSVEAVERPAFSSPFTVEILDSLRENINIYEDRWRHRNVGHDRVKSQYHDAEMAKSLIIRDQVKSELTKGVDEKLLSNLTKIKAMQDAGEKKSKSKKEGKGQGKKGKGKKAGGGKKEKPLPGAKLPGIKDMKVEEMLDSLIQNGLICQPANYNTNDFIGGFQSEYPKFPGTSSQERWIPEDPSACQLRKAIMDYCILPMGSERIKSRIQESENIRSLLFYGPSGSGKTLMAQAIASDIGALFINLSSSTIGNSFGGKEGATKLCHMVFTIAKEKAYSPVVIYLDDCHEFFLGKSKRGGDSDINTEMLRFQKDLLIYKNQALKKEDRVIVIGCTNMPDKGDAKLLKWKDPTGKPEKQGFFERFLYFPKAHHADRAMLWKDFVERRISDFSKKANCPGINYHTLAYLSDGFSAGEIISTAKTVLSEERMKNLEHEPLSERDFSSYFSNKRESEDERFITFTRQITDLESRWKSIYGGKQSDDPKKKKKKK